MAGAGSLNLATPNIDHLSPMGSGGEGQLAGLGGGARATVPDAGGVEMVGKVASTLESGIEGFTTNLGGRPGLHSGLGRGGKGWEDG